MTGLTVNDLNVSKKWRNGPLSSQISQFEVFFDGDCPLCRREMDMVKRKDVNNSVILTDIAAPEFDPAPYTLETLMSEIHGRLPSGEFVTGVEVFRQIYQRIGFRRSVWFSKLPVVKQILDLCYRFFAKIRFWTAYNRLKKRAKGCSDAACGLQSSQISTDQQQKVVS